MNSETPRGCAATRTGSPRADRPRALPLGRFAFALSLATGAALVGGCSLIPGVLSDDDRKVITTHQISAKAYYEVGDFPRAEDQCRRGLAIGSDDNLELLLAYSLLMQGGEKRLAEASKLFDEQVGLLGNNDWRVRMGYGTTLQQLARFNAASSDPATAATAAEMRRDARRELEAAVEDTSKLKVTPPDLLFNLALLDLDDHDAARFSEHGKAALHSLRENSKYLEVSLRQTAEPRAKQRTERDLAANRERGRRIAREMARAAWEREDWPAAGESLVALDDFGGLERADWFNRANVREKNGDIEGAVADYEKFVTATGSTLDDNVSRAIESLTRLRSMLAEKRTATQLTPTTNR